MIAGLLVHYTSTSLLCSRRSRIFSFCRFNRLLCINHNRSTRSPGCWSCFVVTDNIIFIIILITIVCILGFFNLFYFFNFFLSCRDFLLFFHWWSVRQVIPVLSAIVSTVRNSLIIFSISVGDPGLGPNHPEELDVDVTLAE